MENSMQNLMQNPAHTHNGTGLAAGVAEGPRAALEAAPTPAPGSAPLPTVAIAESYPLADLITRLRDRYGNRLPWSFAHSVALVSDRPLEETPLRETLAVIRAAEPGRAGRLHHFYDERLLPAIDGVRKTLVAELHRVVERREDARRRGEAADAAQAAVREARGAATQRDAEALMALDEPLGQAHREAAEAVARTGGSYDPQAPSDACVLRHAPLPMEAVLGEMRLPDPDTRPGIGARAVSWVCTGVVGAMIGVSIGILGQFLQSQSLLLVPAVLGGFIVAGVAIAVMGKKALAGWVHVLSEWFHQGHGPKRWGAFLALAASLVTLLLLGDAAAERRGLLAAILRRETLGTLSGGHLSAGSQAGDLTFWLVPVLATIGYVGTACWMGWMDGRAPAVRNAARARQEAEFAARDAEVRSRGEVTAALQRISLVREVLRRQGLLVERIAETARPFEEKIAWWEGTRVADPGPELDETALRRIQEALDHANGAQMDFDRALEEALASCEAGHAAFWARLRKALFGPRRPRLSTRDPRKHIR